MEASLKMSAVNPVSRTFICNIARYYWVLLYNEKGEFSRLLCTYSLCCLLIVAILDFSAAVRMVYVSILSGDGLDIFNNSFGLSLDVLMFSGLCLNFVSQLRRTAVLERACVRKSHFNKRLFIFTVSSAILTIIAIISRYYELVDVSTLNDQNIDYFWYCCYCLVSFVYYLIAAQYSTFLDSLSGSIQNMATAIHTKQNCSITNLYDFIQNHNIYLEEMKKLHDIYNKQICCVLLDVFADCVYNGFYVTMYSIIEGDDVLNGVGYGSGILVKMLILFAICACCSDAKFQAEAFNRELYKIVMRNSDLCHDKKLVMVVTARRTVTFSAGGFVTLGNELIVSMLTAVTTYLVMLVQCSRFKSSKAQRSIKIE